MSEAKPVVLHIGGHKSGKTAQARRIEAAAAKRRAAGVLRQRAYELDREAEALIRGDQ